MHRSAALDPRGILMLIAAALVGGLFGYFLPILVAGRMPFSPIVTVILTVVCAAVGVGLVNWTWRRQGGRHAVLETNGWIRDRRIPSDVPEQRWRQRLSKRESQARSQWSLLVSACLWIPLGIFEISEHPSVAESAFWVVGIGFYVFISAWVLYYNLRWLPVIRQLLTQREAAEMPAEPLTRP